MARTQSWKEKKTELSIDVTASLLGLMGREPARQTKEPGLNPS